MRTLDLQQLKTTGSPSDRSSSDSVMHGDSPSHPRTNPEDVDRFYQPLYDFHESDFDINDDLDTGWMIAANAAANMRYSVTGAATVAARANEIGVAGAGGGEHNNNNNKTANAAYTRESTMVDDFGLGASNLLNVSPPSKRRAEIVDRFQLEYTVSSGGPMDYPSTIRLSEEFPMYNTSFLSNHQPGNDVFSGGGNGVAAATGQITDVHPNCSSNYSPEYESQLDSSTALTADSAGSSSLMNKSPMAFMINTSSKSVDSTQKPTLETTTPSSNKKLNHSKISGNLSTTTNTASMIACVVCSDKSSGKHYGQYTCEGCKSFFKRSVRRNMLYNCKGTKTCPVDQPHRNQCQYCRFQKCILMGMRKESAVQKGRSSHHYLLLTNRKNPSTIPQQQQSPSKTTKPSVDQLGDSDRPVIKYEYMSQEHRHLSPLTYSVGACNNHHELDHSNTNHILHSQTPSDPPKPSTTSIGETIARVNQLISQTNYENNQNHSINVDFRKRMLAEIREAEMRDKQYDPAFPTECIPNTDSIFELTARLIFIAVRWARDIPIFTDLFTCDRVELLRGSWCHMFLIKVAQTNLSFENVLPLTEEAERDSSDLNLIIDRVEKIRELSLNTVEYGCLKAAVLFSSDSLDIADKIKVSYLQEQAFLSLNDTIKASRGLDVQRLIKILIQAHLIKSIHPDIVERLFFSQTIGRSKMTLIINDMVLSNGYITALDTYRRF